MTTSREITVTAARREVRRGEEAPPW